MHGSLGAVSKLDVVVMVGFCLNGRLMQIVEGQCVPNEDHQGPKCSAA